MILYFIMDYDEYMANMMRELEEEERLEQINSGELTEEEKEQEKKKEDESRKEAEKRKEEEDDYNWREHKR